MSLHPLDWAPCGECGHLVCREAGCTHWRPGNALERAMKQRATRERITEERKGSRRQRVSAGKAAAIELRQSLGLREQL